MKTIDLNCDLGEWRNDDGPENDRAIMPYISSCNIACGGHIGDTRSMRSTVKLAMEYGVAIGAHPSYPDREGFGRRRMELPAGRLEQSIRQQIQALKDIVEDEGGELHHVKPHGALYNTAAIDDETAEVIVRSIEDIDPTMKVYGQSGLGFEQAVRSSRLKFIAEVFADRAYEDDLTLRSRTLEGAVLHERGEVLNQLDSMVLKGELTGYSGKLLPIRAQTVCLHSDTRGSAELARHIHEYLIQKNVQINPA